MDLGEASRDSFGFGAMEVGIEIVIMLHRENESCRLIFIHASDSVPNALKFW